MLASKLGVLVLVNAMAAPERRVGVGAEKLAVIMVDGFRWDYEERMEEDEVPNLRRLIDSGVKASYVQPIFPSLSFPSWTTVATGLPADKHGIVGNVFWDPETGDVFDSHDLESTADPRWWTDHTPLWMTATEAGIRTSLYQWGRCDIPFGENGTVPEKCTIFDSEASLSLDGFSADLSSAALDLSSGFGLTMVYYSNVDELGHIYGPDSQEIRDEVIRVDGVFSVFMELLDQFGILEETNVVFLTDHGMTDESGKLRTRVTRFVDPDLIEMCLHSEAYVHIKLKDPEADTDRVVQDLKQWQGMDVYAKADIPDHLKFRDSDLVLDVLVVSRGQSMAAPDPDFPDVFLPVPDADDDDPDVSVAEDAAGHGFDDTSPEENEYVEGPYSDMRGVFMASGPSFRAGVVTDWIKLLDEYQIFLEVLDLEGEPHEGDFVRVAGMFA